MVNLDPAADHFEYPVSVGNNSASVCVHVSLSVCDKTFSNTSYDVYIVDQERIITKLMLVV